MRAAVEKPSANELTTSAMAGNRKPAACAAPTNRASSNSALRITPPNLLASVRINRNGVADQLGIDGSYALLQHPNPLFVFRDLAIRTPAQTDAFVARVVATIGQLDDRVIVSVVIKDLTAKVALAP
jgi:hypothetical protein